ncbi:uncharacterized protein LOC124442286 isoform X2 [Xenia sp. Carnegie-2017]|uniref:uncharacterized protein LOC124442286 isoform X2 n=1 Tax=Xenia sp. Carnegie-2017 TaxID=2897299 RepID=UPI001F03A3A1|nr:uncharacterized protein LOC124442286 isoform X2 [Xenia sp. Carnegie-2017]
MKGRITIYTITGCPFCTQAKNKLRVLGLEFVEINLDVYKTRRKDMKQRTGRKTVPQIFFNAEHVGGFSDFDSLTKESLDQLIKLVNENEALDDAPPLPEGPEDKEGFEVSEFTCELDEYAELVKQIKASGIVKSNGSFLWSYKNTFKGKELVDWLVSSKEVDRTRGVAMAQNLLEKHFAHHVKKDLTEFHDDEKLYRFLEDDESNALNADVASDCEPRPAAVVGESLRKFILQLYAKYLSKDGKGVDYTAMKYSSEFKAYVNHTAELKRVQLEELTKEEKLAFFINTYNALVIHANVVNGPPVSLMQRYRFFNVVSYIIGGHKYSLHEIESGILRANRRPVASFFRPFSKTDPRLAFALQEPEPLIHFALVCGAKSCPPIKTYTPQDIYEEMKLAGEAFLEGRWLSNHSGKREVKLSMIFKWYKEDFGYDKNEVVLWVYDHMGECQKKKDLAELLVTGDFKLTHMSYNWSLNSK